ncbi:hypothetical protein [Candidatus Nitronereus thalassa]|uniref:Uncharacterized protein n=1 Tax=Candidatus Nitronereus thalassa TaxID=3020898 RepID=A0ABU3K9Q8_9BACT|nr:hypothetical protein [Candidatus Nitronereus thalassa]MDT7043126.1 hypothetical protein [Candidatus Nitronereus thalassa]
MNTTTTTTLYRSRTSIFSTLVISLILFMAWPVISVGQELFSLSTDSGLELYQVEKLRELDLRINLFRASEHPKVPISDIMMETLMVDSGLQRTPHGRLFTMTAPYIQHPSHKMDALIAEIFKENFPKREHEDLGQGSLAFRSHETDWSSQIE